MEDWYQLQQIRSEGPIIITAKLPIQIDWLRSGYLPKRRLNDSKPHVPGSRPQRVHRCGKRFRRVVAWHDGLRSNILLTSSGLGAGAEVDKDSSESAHFVQLS